MRYPPRRRLFVSTTNFKIFIPNEEWCEPARQMEVRYSGAPVSLPAGTVRPHSTRGRSSAGYVQQVS
jgi:hypothetical protein